MRFQNSSHACPPRWATRHSGFTDHRSPITDNPVRRAAFRSRLSRLQSSTFYFLLSTSRANARRAFTLVEMLVSIGLLAFLVLFVSRLVDNAATITTVGNKRMDADSQARQLLDRMALDFSQMLKRNDVSYYIKAGDSIVSMSGGVDVNDRMAFFCANPGYTNQAGFNSNTSLVAYRINNNNAPASSAFYNRVERMGKGLTLNGASATRVPLLFLNSVSPPTTTIAAIWPAAANSTTIDSDYNVIGPSVFRLEYYFLTSASPPALVAYPTSSFKVPALDWSTVDKINIKDVSAIVVAIAAIDSKSRVLLSTAQFATLKGKLVDFTPGWVQGQLLSTWQNALNTDAQIAAMPRPAIQNIRLYERYFYLSQ